MRRIIIRDFSVVEPFAEPARDLRILNKQLWLMQRDLLKAYFSRTTEVESQEELEEHITNSDESLVVHRDNLFFNAALIDTFMARAQALGRPCQIAFLASDDARGVKGDPSIERHALQLCTHITRRDNVTYIDGGAEQIGSVHVADLYYYPEGARGDPVPLLVETISREMGYYHIPSYMATKGDLTYQIPVRAFLSIESWLHALMANVLMGAFSMAAQQDSRMEKSRLKNILRWTKEDWDLFPGKILFSLRAFWEKLNPLEEQWRNHFLSSRSLVKVGKRCSIDPTAIVHGPTTIGDDVYIGPGVVITNSIIGNNVNVMQGSQIMLSVVSDRCFLPFNAGLFMTTLMENSMVAQNSTLQLCIVGRNTFIGANNVFTDFNLQGEPIKIVHQGRIVEINLPVLGSAVGHNCKLGSGFVVYPGRMIESNAVIIFDNDANLIRKTVPGHDVDDMDQATGEPRRIVYHWPNVYIDPADGEQRDDRLEEPPAASMSRAHTSESLGQRQQGDTIDHMRSTSASNSNLSVTDMSVVHDPSAVGVSVTRGG
ncbi:multidrug transporter [Oscillochloris sp. ZM17-4]|uniref:DapH/DapD/GlmU-related protein n=1 Tax=Oscillochloris sp. ZM17-4 TaxID=2866714 RepID=UPI001C7322AA|nr:DapH/DapD/GlmU-related protein [Oscillochloris sp. ZM17-4]MBX0328514.1 multidrug transporter [Oscillochloris sp. ZM17-4]